MRKLIASGVLLIVLMAGGASASPLESDRSAFALWSTGRMKDGSHRIVAAMIWVKGSPTDGTEQASFALLKGVCATGASESCFVFQEGSITGKAKPGEVVVDPLLQTAQLKITRRGKTHEVTWAAQDELHPDTYEAICEDDQAGGRAVAIRSATAQGEILGRVASEKALFHSAMAAGTQLCPFDTP